MPSRCVGSITLRLPFGNEELLFLLDGCGPRHPTKRRAPSLTSGLEHAFFHDKAKRLEEVRAWGGDYAVKESAA